MTEPTDYQGNSKKARAESSETDDTDVATGRPEIKKLVSGEVTIPKKTLGQKFRDTFFDGAFFKGLVHHAYRDVVVPNSKHIMFDVGMEILRGGIYRNGNARRALDPQNIISRITTNYQTPVQRTGMPLFNMQQIGPARPPESVPRPGRNGPVVYNISDRREAEDVLGAMRDIIDSDYKVVSVAELHEMLGREFTHADNLWGWFSIADARIVPDRDGYHLELPQPEAL